MDSDTTGVEPDFSLVKSKKLVGGGEITIVNKTVPMALEKLGYAPNEVSEIEAFVDERNTSSARRTSRPSTTRSSTARSARRDPLHGAREDDGRRPAVHLRRDLEDHEHAGQVTVEDVGQLFTDAWKLGVKAIAIYRDNCKVASRCQARPMLAR